MERKARVSCLCVWVCSVPFVISTLKYLPFSALQRPHCYDYWRTFISLVAKHSYLLQRPPCRLKSAVDILITQLQTLVRAHLRCHCHLGQHVNTSQFNPRTHLLPLKRTSWSSKVYCSFVIQFCWTRYALILSQMASSSLTKFRQKGVSRAHCSYIEGTCILLRTFLTVGWKCGISTSGVPFGTCQFYHADEVSVPQSHTQ